MLHSPRVSWLRRNTFNGFAVTGSTTINRGLIQAIPTSLPPQPIGEATKASNLRRIPPGFTILEEESIDSSFARFNTIITSLKALEEVFLARTTLGALDELIGNLKVHEVVMEKDFEIYKGKKERAKSIALKTKKKSSDDETLTSESDDEEYAMAKSKSDRKCFRFGDPNHLIDECPKPPRNKDKKAFVGGRLDLSENEVEHKTNDETCLMASNEGVSSSLGSVSFTPNTDLVIPSPTAILAFLQSITAFAISRNPLPTSKGVSGSFFMSRDPSLGSTSGIRDGRKITINESDTAGYDKSKVECFNCHKLGHFARECRGPRNQDNRRRNQDSSRRTINVEEISSKAMLAIDGAGFDWSFMADEEVPTDMALMAFSDSEVHNDKTCSKTCLKSFETLKTQLDDLRIEFNKSEFNLATYKRGLASVEEQLVFYKKNEVLFCEQLAVLKRDISYKDSEISVLKSELEKLKQEKESNQLKIENFDNASKSLDKLIGSQIPDKSRKGLGFVSYNAIPPPPTGLFSPLNLDLSNSGLEEFQQPEFEGYRPKTSKSVSEDTSNEVRESPDALLVEELVSNDKLEKKTVFPTVAKINFVRPQQQEKPVRKPVKYAEMYSFNHVQANCNYHQRERMVSGNNYTRVNYNYSAKKAHPSAHRNIVPRAVLMKTGLRPLNTARPVNTAHPKTTVYSARPMSCFSKSAQSTVKRPYSIKTALTNKNYSQKVNTAKGSFYTARPKAVNTARPNSAVVNAVRANQVNAVKASACWVWRPTKLNSASITFKRHNYGHPQKEDQGICPISQTSKNLMEDMLPLGEEPKEEELLVKELLKLVYL
ncbi:ribonuclease H-like domain-containing protein [Tanacetum coccineum]